MRLFSRNKSLGESLQKLRTLQGNGQPDFDIVGTSFYKKNFQSLAKKLRVPSNSEVFLELTLRHDPENSHSAKRQAIGVYSHQLLLGHVPEQACPAFLAALNQSEGIGKANGRIWFGADEVFGIRLSILWPPHFEGSKPEKLPHPELKGDGTFSLKLDTSDHKIDWPFMDKTKSKVKGRKVLEIGEGIESTDGTLYAGDYGRRADFACAFGYVAQVPKSRAKEFDKLLNSLGGHAKVSFRLVRTGKSTHSVHIDFIEP